MTFVHFVEQPSGVTHSNGIITGTVTVTPTNHITVSFVVQVGVPGTLGWTVTVTNRACIYPFGGTLKGCIWSNEVTNPAYRPHRVSVEKLVMPQGQVEYGDTLTYTLIVSAAPGAEVTLYDLLMDATFVRFVEQPAGVIHSEDAITGTLTVAPNNQTTVSFVVQVDVPGAPGLTVDVTNRACVYPLGGALDDCAWSNEVTNPASRAYYDIYLPLVLRNS